MDNEPPDNHSYQEKRKFERAYFSSDDNVTGIIVSSSPENPMISGNISTLSLGGDNADSGLDGDITNLSLGGAYLIFKKDQTLHLKIGDPVTLKEIQANILYSLELDIGMQIRRIYNYEFVEHVGFGFEFIDISDASLAIIKKLVEWGLNSTGDKRCPLGPS